VAGKTVRIREDTRELLRELEAQTGEGPQELLARAVEQFRRSLILAETNVGYARLRADGDEGLDEEVRAWDSALADGLDDDR
jgi:hypothetical protein